MKNLIYLLLIISLCGCTKESIERFSEGDITVTLDYIFPVKSGDMKGASLYLDFYNKYITSKVLTPKTYSINFYKINDITTGQTVTGKWGEKALVALAPGKYIVDGISWPTKYGVCGDTAYLKFNDTIDINEVSTNLVLKAEYDCSLILLDTAEVKETMLFATTANWTFIAPYEESVKPTMLKTEEFYHTFLFNGTANGIGYDKVNLYLSVTSRLGEMVYPPDKPPYFENKTIQFVLWVYTWIPGKYYYFEHTTNGYDIPPMTN